MFLVEEVLKDVGIDYEESGNDFVILCPFHDDSHPSYRIDKESGINNCFVCGSSGNFFKLVKVLTGYDNYQVLLYLNRFLQNRQRSRLTIYNELLSRIQRYYDEAEIESNSVISMPGNTKVRYNKYLADRGISDKEMLFHDIRVCTEYPYKDWVLIPMYRKGILRTYFLRNTAGDGKIYGYEAFLDEEGNRKTEGYYRSDILYNMDNCADATKPIAISEGIFDSILVGRAAEQSVAALSNRLLPEQQEFLKKYPEIILFPDNDERGLFLVDTALKLTINTKVSVALLPDGYKDPGDTKGNIDILKKSLDERINIIDFAVTPKYISFLKQKKFNFKKKR